MFEELRELADTIREHAPVVVEELHRAVDSLAQIADNSGAIRHYLGKLPAPSRDQLTIDQEVTK